MSKFKVCLFAGVVVIVVGQVTSRSALSEETDRPREKTDSARDDEGRPAGEIAELQAKIKKLDAQVREANAAGNAEAVDRGMQEIYELEQRMAELRSRDGDDQPRRDVRSWAGNVPQEVRERLAELKKKQTELSEAGKTEEAKEVARQAREIRTRFANRRPDLPAEDRQRLESLREQIGKLRAAGENEKATRLENEARAIWARHGVSSGSRGRERIEHLRAAVKHLREAGMNDLADKMMAEIEKAEKEGGQRDRPRDGGRDRPESRDRIRD